jgi:hypothetical protein
MNAGKHGILSSAELKKSLGIQSSKEELVGKMSPAQREALSKIPYFNLTNPNKIDLSADS